MSNGCHVMSVASHKDMTALSEALSFIILGVLSALCVGLLKTAGEVWNLPAAMSGPEPVRCLHSPSKYFHPHHKGIPTLGMDQASVVLISTLENKNATICMQSEVCHKCPLVHVTDVTPSQNISVVTYTGFPVTMQVTTREANQTAKVICSQEHVRLEEHGQYRLWINPNENGTYCNFYQEPPAPSDSNIPIYVMLGLFVGLALIWIILQSLHRRGIFRRLLGCMGTERLIDSDLGTPTNVPTEENSNTSTLSESLPLVPPPSARLRSLDTFRGLSLVVMIFANYQGGGYWFFHHSAWNGLTVADLVFPWFVFIMGPSMAISIRSMLRRDFTRLQILWKVLKRTVILFGLGLVVSNQASHGRDVRLDTLRIPGVLQKLAVTYLLVALMEVCFARVDDPHRHKRWAGVRDIVAFWPEWLLALGFVAVHTTLTFLLDVPDCPKGYLGPGGLGDNASHWNCTGGAAGYIDRKIFGDSHIYGHPTTTNPYQTTVPYDPEGLLGCLTSSFLCFLGLQAGKILVIHQDWKKRTFRWLIWCLLTGVIAGALCKFGQQDGVIPVNKNLWSLSFVLAMSSMAFFLLMVLYLVIDVYSLWSGAPFFYPGMNSIAVYIGHEVLEKSFPVQFHVGDTHAEHLAMSAWGTALWVIISMVMYHKQLFIAI